MNKEDLKRVAVQNGYQIESDKRMGNDCGDQIRLTNGCIINCYDKGTISYQGKNCDEVKLLFADETKYEFKESGAESLVSDKNVFVVYGHDLSARTQLEAMLRRWGLEPIILDQLPSEGQTIIEKLENCTQSVNFGVVLATPDDEGHRKGHDDEKAYRARQNVVLELGMLLSKLGRSRVAILINEPSKMERPSDIQGLIYIPYTDNIEETKVQLAKEMEKQGIAISVGRL